MSTVLAPGMAPGALVPGDPARPRALAERLDAYAESAAAAAGQLRSLDAGDWVGEAAEAFRQALAQVPERLERAVGAFAEAASALRAYASVLAEAQERARLALARVETAEADTATWRARSAEYATALAAEAGGGPPAGPAPPSHDPGAPGRSAAEALLEAARADVEAAARAAAERLERAAADAPDSPGSGPRPGTPPGSSSPGRPRPAWSWASWSSSSTPPTPSLTRRASWSTSPIWARVWSTPPPTGRSSPRQSSTGTCGWTTPPGRSVSWSPTWSWPWEPVGAGAAARGAARGAARLNGLGTAARRGARHLARDETGSVRIPGGARAIVTGYVKAFDAAGIPYTRHFAERVLDRTERGVTGQTALSAYRTGSHFFDPKRKNYVRFDRQTGVAVVLKDRIDGPALTVLVNHNRRPRPRWVPVPHRHG